MAFGKEIKRLREKAGWSAQKAADMLGVKVERLRKWEQNDSEPREEDVVSIEAFFGMPINKIGSVEDIRRFQNVPKPQPNGNGNNIIAAPVHDEMVKAKDQTIEALNRHIAFLEMENTRLKKDCETSLADLKHYGRLNAARLKTVVECQKLLRALAITTKLDQRKIAEAASDVDRLFQENFAETFEGGID